MSTIKTKKESLPQLFDELEIGGDILSRVDALVLGDVVFLDVDDSNALESALEDHRTVHGISMTMSFFSRRQQSQEGSQGTVVVVPSTEEFLY